MLSASDIRKGNWLQRPTQPNGFLVDGATIVRFEHSGIRDEKPISLTPELLLKCGFLEDENEPRWLIGDFELRAVPNGFDYEDKVVVQSLHKLQNLYYELCGSELPVNL